MWFADQIRNYSTTSWLKSFPFFRFKLYLVSIGSDIHEMMVQNHDSYAIRKMVGLQVSLLAMIRCPFRRASSHEVNLLDPLVWSPAQTKCWTSEVPLTVLTVEHLSWPFWPFAKLTFYCIKVQNMTVHFLLGARVSFVVFTQCGTLSC